MKTFSFPSFLLVVLLSVLCCSMTTFTGPSWMDSGIIPISVNKKGEILCKTRFVQNHMGGHGPQTLKYGFCVISNDSIIQFTGRVLRHSYKTDSDGSKYYEQREYWDEIFRANTSQEQLNDIVSTILENQYTFTICNADSFKVDKLMSMAKFESEKQVNLDKNLQKSLYGAVSTDYHKEKRVHLEYDFGKICFLENKMDYDGRPCIGADFDYYNGWVDGEGIERNIGFDRATVTGVLFLDKANL